MRLALSSAAAPDATLVELLAACTRRGVAAVELVEGHAHRIAVGMDPREAEAAGATAQEAGVEICALYRERLTLPYLKPAARLAAALGAAVVVPTYGLDREILPVAAGTFAAVNARLLLAHGSEPAAVDSTRRTFAAMPERESRSVGLAWEIRPERDDPSNVGGVLSVAGPHLQYVRLRGGGPEAAQQTGRGVGALMARLTLERYGGALAIAPSESRYHYVWRAWLGRAGGWGCGSKQSDPSLVTL